jgi:predicted DNA-binding protein
MSDELTTLTFRLPADLREVLKTRAAAEGRTESNYLRHYLGQFLGLTQITEDDQ